jgi:hypothetical protein
VAKLGDTLEKNLLSYAATAAAAGVSLLSLTRGAEAKIVYTRVHKVIENTTYQLDLNNDGTTDFTLTNKYGSDGYGNTFAWLNIKGANGGGIDMPSSKGNLALALKKGAIIGSGKDIFRSGTRMMARIAYSHDGNGGYSGFWAHATNRYLGLKFSIQGETHYGWARLTVYVVQGPSYVRSTITGYAYETVPNKPIAAGKEHGQDDAEQQPATLGTLALGKK